MGETILLAKSARSFGEGNMKAGVTLSKIFSTSIALILCSAVFAFALTALCWGAALPAHAAACTPPTPTIVPSHGPVGQSFTVSAGSNNCPSTPSNTVNVGYGATDCSLPTSIGTTSMNSDGSFSGTFTWPPSASTVGTTYQVCITLPNSGGTSTGTFKVDATPPSITSS